MRVFVATEARLFVDSAGRFRAPTEGRSYNFWTRYLEEFHSVGVLARVSQVSVDGGHLVEGPGVVVLPITDFAGVKGVLLGRRKAHAEITRWTKESPDVAFIGRLPGAVGAILLAHARRARRPYAVELVGDAHSAILMAGLGGRASRALAFTARTNLRRQVRGADAVSYVTRETLQSAYPAAARATVASYSSVELPDEAFRARPSAQAGRPPHLVVVGTMSQTYKGHDVLLTAMAILRNQGFATRSTFVGGGKLRSPLEECARSLSLDVTFTGQLDSKEEVRAVLDNADLFVMPSRSEGLPRALLEAMARGLPAVGSAVGGIPELLEPDCLVEPDNAPALAAALRALLTDDERRQQQATRNHAAALEFHHDKLSLVRKDFYSAVRAQLGRYLDSSEEQ